MADSVPNAWMSRVTDASSDPRQRISDPACPVGLVIDAFSSVRWLDHIDIGSRWPERFCALMLIAGTQGLARHAGTDLARPRPDSRPGDFERQTRPGRESTMRRTSVISASSSAPPSDDRTPGAGRTARPDENRGPRPALGACERVRHLAWSGSNASDAFRGSMGFDPLRGPTGTMQVRDRVDCLCE